jgi:hypothetical protein
VVAELVVEASDPCTGGSGAGVDVEQPPRPKPVVDNASNAMIRRHNRRLSTIASP